MEKLIISALLGLSTIFLALHAWIRGNFLNWVSVIIVSVVRKKGKKVLQIRTIDNTPLYELILRNIIGSWVMMWYAHQTTMGHPAVGFGKRHARRMRNILRGHVSSLFREGFLAEVLGQEVVKKWFRLVLVREQRTDLIQSSRLLLVLIADDQLRDRETFSGPLVDWDMEAAHHEGYLAMMRALQEDFLNETPNERFKFVKLELAMTGAQQVLSADKERVAWWADAVRRKEDAARAEGCSTPGAKTLSVAGIQ